MLCVLFELLKYSKGLVTARLMMRDRALPMRAYLIFGYICVTTLESYLAAAPFDSSV
jgi:hypothetical protein